MADLGSTKVFGDLTVAGDIRIGGASGNMTAPDFIQSSAQSTNAAACTRKDYVDSAIAAGDALQVSKTGDTMTGNLTAPKVLVSGAQGTEVNALTRKDYVDAELAKKLNLTGGTLTGNLTAPAVLVSSAQNTSANALTRKDYVDSAIAVGDALRVSKTGDTMTGTLTLSSSTFGTVGVSTGTAFAGMYGNTRVPHLVVADTSGSSYAPAFAARYVHNTGWGGIYSLGVLNHNAQSPGSFCVHHINGGGGQASLWQFEGASGSFVASGAIFTESAQDNNGNALTRKDYVDSQVATRAPMAHTHTAADVGAVSKDGDIMTGALRVRSGVDASGVHVYGGGGGGAVGLVDATGTQRTNFHYNGATGIGSINTYNASGAWVSEVAKWDSASGFGALYPYSTSPQSLSANALTRKDYVDSAIAAGDALQVSKSGDTMTGDLFAPAVLVSSAQNASPNALTRKDYVDAKVDAKGLAQGGSGLGGTSVTFSTVGKTMAVAYLAANGRVYPVTFAIASAVQHGVNVPNRGGENADKDYDLRVAVSVSGNNMTLTTIAGNRCNGIWQVYTM